jgi:diaminopimelate epimerase
MNFRKYQGTGNDFIIIDNRNLIFPKDNIQLIQKLCNRRFGIGADGLILLENENGIDFKMVYYNSDGNQSSMCGNGGRCLVAFAKHLNIISTKATFSAADGLHGASILQNGVVSLQMKDVVTVRTEAKYTFLDTGSPHHVQLVDDLQSLNVKEVGCAIRYSDLYGPEGSNVNFVKQIAPNHFAIRTYERGVEDETLSCGTGATATAIAMYVQNASYSDDHSFISKAEVSENKSQKNNIVQNIEVQGGSLQVAFTENNGVFSNVFLSGPAEFVFDGTIDLTI